MPASAAYGVDLPEARGVRGSGSADEHGVGPVEPPRQAQSPEVPGSSLAESGARGLGDDVQPGQQRDGYPVRGVHEVLAVHRGDVGVPDQPARLRRAQRIPIQMWKDLHRELAPQGGTTARMSGAASMRHAGGTCRNWILMRACRRVRIDQCPGQDA